MTSISYRGRFAPSPSGALHFGSLVTALGSYLEAKTRHGEWHVRIDDLDPPRVVPGADVQILHALEQFGFEWDGEIQYQRTRSEIYGAALIQLERLGRVYPCACSRREIADSSLGRAGATIYPGTCRAGLAPGRAARAWRVNTQGARVELSDPIQGSLSVDLADVCGDFIVKRADGLFAYQLAAVVDDAAMGATHVVRGADLIDSTLRQIYLYRLLGLATPAFLHLPVAANVLGEKWSKQTLAPPLDTARPGPILVRALRFLNQSPPDELEHAPINTIWTWAIAHWRLDRVPRERAIVTSA